jgi:hypothetical protein
MAMRGGRAPGLIELHLERRLSRFSKFVGFVLDERRDLALAAAMRRIVLKPPSSGGLWTA